MAGAGRQRLLRRGVNPTHLSSPKAAPFVAERQRIAWSATWLQNPGDGAGGGKRFGALAAADRA